MQFLLRMPFQRKLLVLMMVTSTAALILAAAAFSAYEWFVLRDVARRDVQAQAEILAANLSAALQFNDADHARRTLGVLRSKPQFDLACVFDDSRNFVAGFTNEVSGRPPIWPEGDAKGVHSQDGRLVVFQPVVYDGQVAGTLLLRSESNPFKSRFRQFLSLAALVLVACWILAFWLAARLQRVVSRPILHLWRTTREVAEHKDYSLRAVRESDDEVGTLITGFNEMLAQIQTRDAALQKAHDGLERRVVERTSELQKEVLERRRIEAALAHEKERLAVTLRSLGEAVVATDGTGRIMLFNPVAEQLTGWSFEEAATRPLSEVLQLLHEKTGQPREDPVDQVLRSGGPVELGEHILLVSRDGTHRLIASSGAPLRDLAGQIIGVVLVLRDVTEKERTTQELLKASKLESIGLLAGGIAHDFNNILTVVLGNISLARMVAPPDDELARALTVAEQASMRAAGLTRQLLTFAKGGLPVKQTASLAEIIEETTAFVLHGSKVRLQLTLPDDLWPAEIDVGQISQVLHNLCLNAVQAMPDGGTLRIRAANVTLNETVSPSLRPGNYIAIHLQDTGPGIPAENLPRIFDPYFTTKKHGSGLGLATSYSIIRKHDGDLLVQSEVGHGTTFQVYLPASSGTKTGAPTAAPAALAGHGRVLIMDDEEAVRILLERMLRPLGYEVALAANGEEALARYAKAQAAQRPFDVVILDLTIPGGMGGLETLRQLRNLNPAVKAVVSSGYSDDPVMAQHQEYGFAGVVAKPYRLEDLARTLQAVMGVLPG